MKPRQTLPRQWLVIAERTSDPLAAARRLPRGSGILVVGTPLGARERKLLERIAGHRGLGLIDEGDGKSLRVHTMCELRRSGSAAAPVIFLSPIFATASHPRWMPLPRMRAATLARLSRMPVIALGGMSKRRFASVAKLGFHGWAGIDAWKP